ncbi:V-type proton ATPase subunit S1-like [Salvelinus namaycush]|uniref:V-type proton ATPase subunit S1-like n=1 Tax=Salvelinus namaycush TaxID=8040 RepID=A0A8U1C0M7_SALNM|nr:V-type proton ATPase subunit S1-like [Salvelinus namaycush]
MAGSESLSKMRTKMAFIALLFALLSTGSCSSQVPLVMWSSEGYTLPQLSSPAAGHIISNVQLMAYLNSALGSAPHNVLLFLQDKLSKDDFTRYGGVFGNKQDSAFPNLESALQSSSSPLVLPALSWLGASAVPSLLQEKLGVSPLSVDPDTLEHLRFNASENTLLVINLPYSSGAYLSCKDVLRNNDEVIGKVLNIMKAQSVPYVAIYTGLKPSRVIEEPSLIGQSSMSRSLLQAVVDEVKPPLMFNSTRGPCIMLWAQNLNVSFSDKEWIDLGPSTFASGGSVSTSGSFCNETNSKLVLDYGSSVSPYNPFRLIFSMSQRRYPVSARNWFTLDTVELVFNTLTATYNGSHGIYAPAEYSFHCQNVNNFRNALLVPRTQNATQWRILFTDFQIQGFSILNGTTDFSYASDCAGFFTPGIWMGLITSLLMLLILTYGLHMIMQLRSMDRFDDPKGPCISVPQSE